MKSMEAKIFVEKLALLRQVVSGPNYCLGKTTICFGMQKTSKMLNLDLFSESNHMAVMIF